MASGLSDIEKSLLIGRWQLPESAADDSPVTTLAKNVVDGAFRPALTSPLAQATFKAQSEDLSEEPLSALVDWTPPSGLSEQDAECARLALAVACARAFVQPNWTGPDLDVTPKDIIVTDSSKPIDEEALNSKAVAELASGGEPAYHLAQHPLFLRLAQILLSRPFEHCLSAAWWRLRVTIIHQQLLDEPVAVSPDLLSSLEPLFTAVAGEPELEGRLLLEQGVLEHIYGHDKLAADFFVRAARATGLRYELTGALGKRTKFQVADLSQLVLLAESTLKDKSAEGEEDAKKDKDASTDSNSNSGDSATATTAVPDQQNGGGPVIPETLALNDDTLLEKTEFTSSAPNSSDSAAGGPSPLAHLDPGAQPALHPLDQCIFLAMCLNVRNQSPSHGLTSEQMSPYVQRVLAHPRNWSVHTMALLLRARLESTRTRTVERATLQLQALVEQMPSADAPLGERLGYVHDISLPSRWEMERELAGRFLSLGVVKSALEIFERLEMWEEVVKCWQAMERRDKGIAIVRDLLEGRKTEAELVTARGKTQVSAGRRSKMDAAREAQLWCLLGELEPDNAVAHYEHAWALSKGTSGRAMRSLGGYYFARQEYAKAVPCLERAVKINPLLSRSWFTLGCAYIRLEKWEGGRDAFSRCVTIDDEDAESWNNLASMYLRLDESGKKAAIAEDEEAADSDAEIPDADADAPKAVPFSNKTLAFQALKRGLKYKYDSWRMWTNYMVVAMDVGELAEACRAQGRIVELRAAKDGAACVDADVLERLVDAVTRAPPDPDDATEGGGAGTDAARRAVRNPNEGHGLHRRVADLLERTILPRVASPRVFRAHARLLTWQARWEDAVKAYLDAYRGGAAGAFERGETDVGRWREALAEVEDVVDVLRNFGARVEGYKWWVQARSIVRTFMGRSKDFEDEPEWVRLTALQEDLREAQD
ncbi:tetratricopeptide repeat domain 27 [Coniophora puteana RWD-64-598 SS2]|uniref:Tetratricopeptide repeat domain 27 n=1 Tax=Coniophora puteana (strain RWD-64-598) TaxID=741705 RepID=A0A5M3MAF3_CONPW|nr:tetratricopeptide repeat domain 27 [Coniophora puteana RWD-64-598 SS2]EIW76262.1 tetratricopeptide repeat domain 27 [Coniophora puteana RWD-64-598 SS2]